MQTSMTLQLVIQISCAILCSIMAFLGTWYASKATLRKTYISEHNNRHRQIFDKKINEYSKFYSLALQEIDLSDMTLDGITKNLEVLKNNYKKVQKSCALLSVFCNTEESRTIKKISATCTEMYILFLENYNKLNKTDDPEDQFFIKKNIITEYNDRLGEIMADLQQLEDLIKISVKEYSNY